MEPPPVLDEALADEFFVAHTPEEIGQLREMVSDFQADIAPRFARLFALAGPEGDAANHGRHEVHQLRGVVANYGFAAAAARLKELEYGWAALASDQKQNSLRGAEADVQAGLAALRRRYPHLAGA